MGAAVVHIKGYLTEAKLAAALKQIVGSRWSGVELRVADTKRRWDMGFVNGDRRVVVEYDGDEQYRNTMKIKADREKDAVATAEGIQVVRVPYWVQLDRLTLRHYFNFDAEIEQNFPHGFVTTEIFPASFCPLGLERFERELARLPVVVRDAVVRSLQDRAAKHGAEYVLPSMALVR
jgi:hypothetical protein